MVTFVTILQLLTGLIVILAVLFQSGKNAGLGVVAGAADTFLSKSTVPGCVTDISATYTSTTWMAREASVQYAVTWLSFQNHHRAADPCC